MNIVLLGGNGYIGKAVTQAWLNKDQKAEFYVVSRSGKNTLVDPRVHNIKDKNISTGILEELPEEIDYIVDFVGGPDRENLYELNMQPALVMKEIAERKQVRAMGFVGGILGPKAFVDLKTEIIQMLKNSSISVKYVEPTLVYGGELNDALAKMGPLFKVLGVFTSKMKPIHVDEVALDLVEKLRSV